MMGEGVRKAYGIIKSPRTIRGISSFCVFFISFTLLFGGPSEALSQVMTSPSYQLQRDSINFGGERSVSASYQEEDTAGEVGTGRSTSASFNLEAGFQQQDTPDTQSPTTPTTLVATALSSSEISLSWNASLDNIGIGGYQIFRNGVALATTTSASYSDTGLASETSYDYNVQAFDTSFNYSSTSATATAATLAVTETSPTLGGGNPFQQPNITDVSVAIGTETADLDWVTDLSTRATLRWGETGDYEAGNYQEVTFFTDHGHQIEGLQPDTEYVFAINVITEEGRTNELLLQRFRTLPLADSNPPVTVLEFNAFADTEGIDLIWTNPLDEDFDGVRIVRSEIFYPSTIFDGVVVYEGSGTTIRDESVQQGATYFYTLFTRDANGNYSSGAIARARVPFSSDPIVDSGTGDLGGVPDVSEDPFSEIPDSKEVHPLLEKLTLKDFDFYQDGKLLLQTRKFVAPVDAGLPLTISIDYEKMPEVLKTIGISLVDPDDESKRFSFLLRVNEEKTQYTATLAPLERIGTYDMNIVVLDVENQNLKRVDGALRTALFSDTGISHRAIHLYYVVSFNIWKIVLLLIVLVLPPLIYLRKGRKQPNETEG